MDGEHFDTLLKTVTATGSRRQMLRRLLTGALAVGAAGTLRARPAAAAPTWCVCTYFCAGDFVSRCEKAIDGKCPEDRRIQGLTCPNIPLASDMCGDSKKDVCG